MGKVNLGTLQTKHSVRSVINKMRCALLTGATGLLGSWLVRRLVAEYDRVFVIARSKDQMSATDRVRGAIRMLGIDDSEVRSIMSRITIYEGDIEREGLGLKRQDVTNLSGYLVSDVFHSAARAEFEVPYKDIYVSNVVGTQNVLSLCMRLNGSRQTNGQITLHYVSTVAVAGDSEGIFTEADFDRGQKFHNTYERTKYEAERLVRSRISDLRVVIYRPGILTGDSLRGVTTNFKMLYQPIHFLAFGLFGSLPGNPDTVYSFVPVDAVTDAIVLLSRQVQRRSGKIYQLIGENHVSLREFVESICEFYGSRLPELESAKTFPRGRLSELQWKLIRPFVPYFNYQVRFAAETTNSLLRRLGYHWPPVERDFLNILYRYCQECGFVRKPLIPCS